jgi:transcription antitermination factor NusG
MNISSISQLNGSRPPTIAATEECDSLHQVTPNWYAIHTSANHEKTVAGQLAIRGVEHFFPVYDSLRRWKDRKVHLHLALFPGYLFVRIDLQDRLRVLQIPGVARLVGFSGTPAALSDQEIAHVRALLHPSRQAEPYPFLQAGRRVTVQRGPLEGMQGVIVRRKNRRRLVITFELIQRSIAVEVDMTDISTIE